MPYYRSVHIRYSRKSQMEGWFYWSMFISAFILILAVVGALPGIVEFVIDLMFPVSQTGAARTETASTFQGVCLVIAVLSGLYFLLALGVHISVRRSK